MYTVKGSAQRGRLFLCLILSYYKSFLYISSMKIIDKTKHREVARRALRVAYYLMCALLLMWVCTLEDPGSSYPEEKAVKDLRFYYNWHQTTDSFLEREAVELWVRKNFQGKHCHDLEEPMRTWVYCIVYENEEGTE